MRYLHFLFLLLIPQLMQAQNSRPVAVPDIAVGLEDLPILFDALANDTDADGDSLSFSMLTQPRNGTITGNLGTFMIYQGNQDFNGIDNFFYRVCDNSPRRLCSIGLVSITVNPVNDVPTAANDTFEVYEDSPTVLTVASNDADVDRDTLRVTVLSQPPNGTAAVQNLSRVRYTPDANFNGIDQFNYRLTDGATPNFLCPTARVFIKVLPVNDAPVAKADTIWVSRRDSLYSVVMEQNDFDIEGDILNANLLQQAQSGSVLFDASGNLLYQPDLYDMRSFSMDYKVCDVSLCDTGRVMVIYLKQPEEIRTELFIPEGFSPDGDGINDLYELQGAEAYAPVQINIMNRQGVTVYESFNYKNTWDGTFNGEGLPDGTYFYVLELAQGGGTHKGHIILQR